MQLSLVARLRLMAGAITVAILGMAAHTGMAYHDASLEQRLSTTRQVVGQATAIAQKYQGQQATGALSADVAKQKAMQEIKALRYDGQEYVWINDMAPRMVMHPIKPELDGKDLGEMKDPNGKHLFVEFVNMVKQNGSGNVDYLWAKPGEQQPVPKRSYVAEFKPWGWVLGSGVYVDDVKAAATRFALVNVGMGLVLALGVFGFLQWFSSSLRRRLQHAHEALEGIAGGDLTIALDTGRADEIGALLTAITHSQSSLSATVAQVRSAADNIQTSSSEVALGAQDLSVRTEETASNLQAAASSMEELTSTVRQTADAARTANQLAATAAESARKGGEVVSEVVTNMQDISAASRKINDIISVIDGIAFQTNILALNAAVEAARAGEQGRGFAVVAGEVRTLAQRSATAAREIKTLIGASVERVESGSRLVQTAGEAMADIVGGVQRVSDIIGEITAASAEQSDGLAQVNGAVVQLDQMTQQNAALVEESAAAAESLKDQATRLSGVVSRFRLHTGDAVRAAHATAPASPSALAPTRQTLASASRRAATSPARAKPKSTAAIQAKPAATPKSKPASAAKAAAPSPVAAPAGGDSDWESF